MDKKHSHQTTIKLFNVRQFNEAGREEDQSSSESLNISGHPGIPGHSFQQHTAAKYFIT